MELLLDKTVKLFNGSEVSWEEFSGWSSHRQMMNLKDSENFIMMKPNVFLRTCLVYLKNMVHKLIQISDTKTISIKEL